MAYPARSPYIRSRRPVTLVGGYEAKTLTGDVTLSVRESTFLRIDPGGASRNVTLPLAYEDGAQLHITNAASEVTENLVIKNHDGTTLKTIKAPQCAVFFKNGKDWVLHNSTSPNGLDGEIVVATSGGDYTSIKSALAAATSGNVVTVFPGTYQEQNPLNIPNGVVVRSKDSQEIVVVEMQNANQHGFVFAAEGSLIGFTIKNTSTSGFAGVHVPSATTEAWICCTEIFNCDIGILVESTSDNIYVNRPVFHSGTNTAFIKAASGGKVNVDTPLLEDAVTLTDAILADGSGSEIVIHNGILRGDNSTNGLHVKNDGIIRANSVVMSGFTYGARIATTDGKLYILGCTLTTSDTWDLFSEGSSSDSEVYVSGTVGRINKVSLSANTGRQGDMLSDEVGDKGVHFLGELVVGLPGNGREAVVGEGDSYTQGVYIFANTNAEAGTWADNTTAGISGSGSTFTAFNALTTNASLYVGQDTRTFPGVKVTMDGTAIDLGSGAIVAEYWNGSAWTEFNVMATDANAPYTQHAQTVFERNNQSDQIRFGTMTGWATKTLNGQSAYWMRWRVTGDITASPVIEQIKAHSNRWEANSDGFTERFGSARRKLPIQFHQRLMDSLSGGSSPGNGTIVATSNISVGTIDNRFTSVTDDSLAAMVSVPEGLDTSLPVTCTVLWIPKGASSGSVQWDLRYGSIQVGDSLDGTISDALVSDTTSGLVAGDTDVLKKTTLDFTLPNILVDELIALSLTRNSTTDTYGSNVDVVLISLEGTFWR